MKEAIKKVLICRAGYAERAAEVTADQIVALQHHDLKKAVAEWLRTGAEINVGEQPYDVASLMKNHKLKYPAAILFIDWYRASPEEAVGSMAYWGGC